ncbi:DUF4097 family beta strand repeat-containing protein [Glycomyces sp. NRRL B-16210]|uniref:DUF4097 family beta strand repeat-containing protein n=1 Tax=Glycomyces sp. NRRL B-16210 TaxID=1463821 RepID=UPI00068CF666|nr:DUF4097 family beta strand repeat-containing protein [Glycomyces sp. NRRL B-16210]
MRVAPIAAAIGFALTAALGGCATGTDDSIWNLGAFSGELTIEVAGADLDIREAEPGDADDAITVTRHVTAGREVEAGPVLDDQRLDLTADCGFSFFGDCTIRYEITVPPATPVTVEGENGSVTAIALGAATTVSTDNGAITIEEAAGPLDLRTDNGAIAVTDVSSKSVEAVSSNGTVDLSFGTVPDLVRVTTENGAVTVAVPPADYQVTTTTDNGAIDNDLAGTDTSPRRVDITTENGAISLLTAD